MFLNHVIYNCFGEWLLVHIIACLFLFFNSMPFSSSPLPSPAGPLQHQFFTYFLFLLILFVLIHDRPIHRPYDYIYWSYQVTVHAVSLYSLFPLPLVYSPSPCSFGPLLYCKSSIPLYLSINPESYSLFVFCLTEMRDTIWYLRLWVWFISLNIVFPRRAYISPQMIQICHALQPSSIPLYISIPHFLYPIVCPWLYRLLLGFTQDELRCYKPRQVSTAIV